MKKTGYAHAWKEAYIRTNIQSYYHLFFSPDDPIDIARKKWYDYLGYDYTFFWDVYSNGLGMSTLSIYDITKINDLIEIIWFINPIWACNI